jgi:stage III sporulation protein AD
MDVIQVAALAVAGVLLAVQFKSGKAEYGIYLGAALSILIFFQILGKLNVILEVIKTIGELLPLNKIFAGTLLKMLGITYVAEFSASICQDAGYQTIARQIEILGKLTILVMSMPILLALLQTIREFLT